MAGDRARHSVSRKSIARARPCTALIRVVRITTCIIAPRCAPPTAEDRALPAATRLIPAFAIHVLAVRARLAAEEAAEAEGEAGAGSAAMAGEVVEEAGRGAGMGMAVLAAHNRPTAASRTRAIRHASPITQTNAATRIRAIRCARRTEAGRAHRCAAARFLATPHVLCKTRPLVAMLFLATRRVSPTAEDQVHPIAATITLAVNCAGTTVWGRAVARRACVIRAAPSSITVMSYVGTRHASARRARAFPGRTTIRVLAVHVITPASRRARAASSAIRRVRQPTCARARREDRRAATSAPGAIRATYRAIRAATIRICVQAVVQCPATRAA
jgi:hypothetical protein